MVAFMVDFYQFWQMDLNKMEIFRQILVDRGSKEAMWEKYDFSTAALDVNAHCVLRWLVLRRGNDWITVSRLIKTSST